VPGAVRVVRAGAVRAGLVAPPVRPGGVVSAGWALPAGQAAWPAVPPGASPAVSVW